jgi:endonuclease III
MTDKAFQEQVKLDQHEAAASEARTDSYAELAILLHEVDRRLAVYGTSNHYNRADPLEELVFIILSAQTEAYSYLQTFDALRQHFPNWADLLEASEDEIAAVIRRGGLSRKKARQIKLALKRIVADTGAPSLNFLHDLDDEAVLRYLTSLPGVGNKTATCIMVYALGRQVFAVDTHVWRVCRRLGLTPQVAKPTPALEKALGSKVPPELRYTLHVNMVSHGRKTCTPYWPKCGSCVLANLCPSRDQPDQVWADWSKPRGVWANALAKPGEERSRAE